MIYCPHLIDPPVNLLDNSNFRDPVNGRGAVHYTANGYTINRWLLWESTGNVALTVGGGMIYWRGYLYQHLAIDTARRYTLAACTSDGDILCVSGTPSERPAVTSLGNLQLILTVSYPDGQYVKAQVSTIDPSQASSLVWAALYEGTYTADTLPPYIPRPYSVELAECQRYYRPFIKTAPAITVAAHAITAQMVLDPPMRAGCVPTVTINSVGDAYTHDGIRTVSTSYSDVNDEHRAGYVFYSAESVTVGTPAIITGISGFVSSEL